MRKKKGRGKYTHKGSEMKANHHKPSSSTLPGFRKEKRGSGRK